MKMTEKKFVKLGGVKEPYEDDMDDCYHIIRSDSFDITREGDGNVTLYFYEGEVRVKNIKQIFDIAKVITV